MGVGGAGVAGKCINTWGTPEKYPERSWNQHLVEESNSAVLSSESSTEALGSQFRIQASALRV